MEHGNEENMNKHEYAIQKELEWLKEEEEILHDLKERAIKGEETGYSQHTLYAKLGCALDEQARLNLFMKEYEEKKEMEHLQIKGRLLEYERIVDNPSFYKSFAKGAFSKQNGETVCIRMDFTSKGENMTVGTAKLFCDEDGVYYDAIINDSYKNSVKKKLMDQKMAISFHAVELKSSDDNRSTILNGKINYLALVHKAISGTEIYTINDLLYSDWRRINQSPTKRVTVILDVDQGFIGGATDDDIKEDIAREINCCSYSYTIKDIRVEDVK